MANQKNCVCSSAPKLVFTCSGAADVGALSYHAARKLTSDGVGKLYCLAGIGGRVKDIMDNTKTAQVILAIDGCELNCAKYCLEQAGFTSFCHFTITELGFEKGKCQVTASDIARIAKKGEELINANLQSRGMCL